MDGLIKIIILGIICIIASSVIKKQNSEIAFLITIAAIIIVLTIILPFFRPVLEFLDKLTETAGLSPAILSPVIKIMGISVLTKIGSEVCKDAGQGALASAIDLAGVLTAVIISLPLLQSVLSMINSFA